MASAWPGLPAKRRPTAAFCANDLIALGLLQQSIGGGRRVPEDLAIVGYDDIEFASAAAVPLTSVRQPRQELGRTAAQLVMDEATNPLHAHTAGHVHARARGQGLDARLSLDGAAPRVRRGLGELTCASPDEAIRPLRPVPQIEHAGVQRAPASQRW